METLATDLRRDGFSSSSLIRTVCLSNAYQRQPTLSDSSEDVTRREVFAARTVRPLTPEQWITSVDVVLDRPPLSPPQLAQRSRQLLGLRIRQAPASDPFLWTETSQTLVRQLSGPVPPPIRDLESTFLATYARKPTDEERELLAGYTSQETVFALVHSSEFAMND